MRMMQINSALRLYPLSARLQQTLKQRWIVPLWWVIGAMVGAGLAAAFLFFTPTAFADTGAAVPADAAALPAQVTDGPAISAATASTPPAATVPESHVRAVKHKASKKSVKAGSIEEPVFSTQPERFVWNHVPIRVTLGVGADKERRIVFPSTVFIGIPPELEPFIRVQTVDTTSYLTATAPFPKTRIVAEDRTHGTVILLDVNAVRGAASVAPVEIVLPSSQADRADSGSHQAPGDSDGAEPAVDMVTLTRFAAKQFYAPRRLATTLPGVRRVPLDGTPLNGLYRGALISAVPMASWRADDLYVTAVRLQNESRYAVVLDPRALRGEWRAATFQHSRLLPKNDEADTTAVYLISDRPFEAARD